MSVYCHTRPEGKTHQIPTELRIGRRVVLFSLSQPASQPASQPPYRPKQNLSLSGISQEPIVGSYSNFKLELSFKLRWPNPIGQILNMKKTSNGRWPQNIRSGISQEPMVGSYSNFKPKLRWPNHILQMEYLSKHYLEYTQTIFYNSLTSMKKTSIGRRPQIIKCVI